MPDTVQVHIFNIFLFIQNTEMEIHRQRIHETEYACRVYLVFILFTQNT